MATKIHSSFIIDKNLQNGVAGLDTNSKIYLSQLGTGIPSINTVLNGDRQWVTIESLFGTTTTSAPATTTTSAPEVTTTSTTASPDTTPANFTFNALTNQELNMIVTSNSVTITNINVPTTVTILYGTASINGGPDVTSGTVLNGQTVVLKTTTPASYNSLLPVSYTIGTVTGAWNVTTRMEVTTTSTTSAPVSTTSTTLDSSPTYMNFSPNNATITAINEYVYSDPITISGLSTGVSFNIMGSDLSHMEFAVNSTTEYAVIKSIKNGDSLRVRLKNIDASTYFNVKIKNANNDEEIGIWSIYVTLNITTTSTTASPDITPANFTFNALTNQELNTTVTSNSVTITDINVSTNFNITNGTASINGGQDLTYGTILNNQNIILKTTTNNTNNSTKTVNYTIGTVSGSWNVTTKIEATTTTSTTTSTTTTLKPISNWVAVPDGVVNISSVSFGNGRYVGTTPSGVVVSTDGLSWSPRSWPVEAEGSGGLISFANDSFYIVSSNNSKILKSSTGDTWTVIPQTYWGSYVFGKIAYGNGYYVAVGIQNGGGIVSYNGTGFSPFTFPISGSMYWSDVVFGNGKFVAISNLKDGIALNNVSVVSTNGSQWTTGTLPSMQNWSGLTFGNGIFVAIAKDVGTYSTSTDGINWTARNFTTPGKYVDITFGNGLFVAIAGDGSSLSCISRDGITWVEKPLPSYTYWKEITYGDVNGIKQFLAISPYAYSTYPQKYATLSAG